MRSDDGAYQSWLLGEVLLFGLLSATLALFATYPELRPTYELPQVRLVLDTMVALAAVLVAVLAGVRFSVEGRRLDLLLCGGFSLAAASTFAFGIAPVLGGAPLHRTEQWAWIWGRVLAGALIASAAFARKREVARRRARALRRRRGRTPTSGSPARRRRGARRRPGSAGRRPARAAGSRRAA